jgi:non-ribosomal peptide synthetase component F
MTAVGIHRLVEQRAAESPDASALVEGTRTLTYHELNRRANLVARRLMNQGFRRGGQAVVNGDCSLELAVVLLGVLKAGGAYSWLARDDEGWPPGLSFLKADGVEQKWLAVDVMGAMAEPAPPVCPNLPIVTRAGDVACVLRGVHGAPEVLVPHEAVTALLENRPVPHVASWSGDPGALDLWLTLMTGSTAVITAQPAVAAA